MYVVCMYNGGIWSIYQKYNFINDLVVAFNIFTIPVNKWWALQAPCPSFNLGNLLCIFQSLIKVKKLKHLPKKPSLWQASHTQLKCVCVIMLLHVCIFTSFVYIELLCIRMFYLCVYINWNNLLPTISLLTFHEKPSNIYVATSLIDPFLYIPITC